MAAPGPPDPPTGANPILGGPSTNLSQVINEQENIKTILIQIQVTMQGNQQIPSCEAIVQLVKRAGPLLTALDGGLTALIQRVNSIESTLVPVLTQVTTEITKLEDKAQNTQMVIDREVSTFKTGAQATQESISHEFQTQNTKHDQLIQHANAKFSEIEARRQQLVDATKTKFDALANFETQAAAKVLELDMKLNEVLYNVAAGVTTTTNTGVSDGRNVSPSNISEMKAIQFLDKYSEVTRSGFKTWTRKLKNALDVTRGPAWRAALEGIENHKISSAFEELTSFDDQWDDWFISQYGFGRVDGGGSN